MRLQRNFIRTLWLAAGISWCALAALSEAALAEKEVAGKPQGWEFPDDPGIKWVEEDNGNRFRALHQRQAEREPHSQEHFVAGPVLENGQDFGSYAPQGF
jgi:hypothetical protein